MKQALPLLKQPLTNPVCNLGSLALTKLSLRFGACLKAIRGWSLNTLLCSSEASKMVWSLLTMLFISLNAGWNVTTSWIRSLLLSLRLFSCLISTSQFKRIVRATCSCTKFSLYPLLTNHSTKFSDLVLNLSSSEKILLSLRASPYGIAFLMCHGWQELLCKY